MLYGFPKSSRRGTPNAHDKDRSLSLGGKRAEGSMEIEADGIVYRIQRANLRRTASSEAVITELDTGMRINVGEEPGKVFLGVDRETFESCLWCGQTRASTIDGGKVTQTLSNLSLTADESVDGGENFISTSAEKAARYPRYQSVYQRSVSGFLTVRDL